ncbi:MAG: hypothetical protein GY711_29555 [bacterium]|nr:hypothetical protein [bacterium]
MKRISARQLFGISAVGVLTVAATTSTATSFPFFLTAWQAMYPGSMTDDNVINGTGGGCQVCHQSAIGGNGWNAYGWQLRMETQTSGNINLAMTLAEPINTDLDPTGSSALTEISSDTQPGWTPGANNTIFFSNGTTLGGQSPPAGILGDLDPGIGTNYCGPAVPNSSGASGTISASGSPAVADNNLTLTASSLPQNQFGYFLASSTQGFIMNPGGSNGNFCLGTGNTTGRYNGNVQNSGSSGEFSLTIDLTAVPIAVAPGTIALQPGDTWNFQCWFRDTNMENNFTDGLEITFT